jgi:hypothetical protein
MLARTRKMANLVIEETSGVEHPAHLHEGWLVMKSADESEVQRVLDESLTEEEIMPENTQDEVTPAATDEQVEAPATEATETVEDVEKAEMTMEEAMNKIAELQAKLVELESKESEDEMAKSATVADEFLKSAPESVVKMIEDFKKQAESATEELRKEREAKADADAIEKAKGFANLNLDAEKVGPALRRLSSVDSDLAKSVEDILTSVNAQAESANIFAEIGKSADFTPGDAYGRMTTMAKSLVEEGSAKSFEQAFASVASQNPELYVQYRNEKGAN